MADIILHRRSFDTGSVPTTHSLGIAQFAINVPDGKVFIHKSSSVSESIVSVVTADSITTGSITLTETASAALFIGTFSGSMVGNITNADTSSIALRLEVQVQNKTGATIPKGKVVRISGSVGDNPLVTTASYINDANSANTLGFTTVNIATDGSGSVITNGVLTGVNTSGFTAGDLLYLGPTGSYTTTAPVAPLHGVRLGEVLRVHASQGSIYVNIINGFELGELHDIVDNTTTASFGDLLVKSGSVWTNLKQLTGSYGLSGSLTMWQSASVSGTNVFGTASWADTASFVQSRYTREWHVSAQSAYDTGSGDLLRPFRTIAEAIAKVTSGEQIVIHPGTYNESFNTPTAVNNVTITAANTEIGGLVNITGTASIDQTVATIRLVGLNLGSVVHSGTRNLYLQNCTVNGALSKTGAGYLEINNSTLQSGATSITGAGSVVIYNSLLGVVTVNNASAVVNLSNNITMVTPTCQAGTLAIDGGYAYSTGNTTGAVFGSAGAVVALKDLQCITPSSTQARITLNANTLTSIQNVAYDRVNSVTGSSLSTRVQFQQLRAEGFTGSLLGTVTSAETASYADPGFKIGSASFHSYKQDTLSVGNYLWPFPSGSSKGSILTYNVISESNARTGQALISWVNRTCSYTETTTLDIGNTSGVTLSCSINTAGDIVHAFYFPSVSWSLSILATLL